MEDKILYNDNQTNQILGCISSRVPTDSERWAIGNYMVNYYNSRLAKVSKTVRLGIILGILLIVVGTLIENIFEGIDVISFFFGKIPSEIGSIVFLIGLVATSWQSIYKNIVKFFSYNGGGEYYVADCMIQSCFNKGKKTQATLYNQNYTPLPFAFPVETYDYRDLNEGNYALILFLPRGSIPIKRAIFKVFTNSMMGYNPQ